MTSCFVVLRVALPAGSDCGDPDTRKVSGNSPLFSQSQQIKSTDSNNATTMLSIVELFAIIEDDLDGSSIINDSKTDAARLWVILSNPMSNGLIRFLVLWFGL